MKRKIRYTLPPKQYFWYLGLIAFAVALFTAYSLRPEEWKINLALKQPEMAKLWAKQDTSSSVNAPSETLQSVADEAVTDSTACDSTQCQAQKDATVSKKHPSGSGIRFLLIGDSMNEYLRIRLNDYCKKNGYTSHTVIWYSSSTEWYGSCDTLRHFIEEYNPNYILLTIGSNELFIRNIKEKRDKYVKRILAQVGDIPYVWIGPPNWKEDTGINEMILENVGRGRYFESKKLEFKRKKDKAHPVRESAFAWMDEIASFLANEADTRVPMEVPDTAYGKPSPTVILKPKR